MIKRSWSWRGFDCKVIRCWLQWSAGCLPTPGLPRQEGSQGLLVCKVHLIPDDVPHSCYLISCLLRFLMIRAMFREGSGSLSMSRWLTFSKTLWWTGWLWVCLHLKQPWWLILSLEFILFSFDPLMWAKMYQSPGLHIHFFAGELSDSFHFRQKNHFIYDLYLDMSKFYSFLRSEQPHCIITPTHKNRSV